MLCHRVPFFRRSLNGAATLCTLISHSGGKTVNVHRMIYRYATRDPSSFYFHPTITWTSFIFAWLEACTSALLIFLYRVLAILWCSLGSIEISVSRVRFVDWKSTTPPEVSRSYLLQTWMYYILYITMMDRYILYIIPIRILNHRCVSLTAGKQ